MTQAEDSEQNPIWMLFANGEAARVQLTIHKPPAESVIPADAFVIAGRAGLMRSARRAASVAFNWLNSSGREQEPFLAGFDLAGLSAGPVSGESGGLAFALALVASLCKVQVPPIAATGDITSGHGEGEVVAVNGIEEKLKGAVQLLEKGAVIFYPMSNDGEICASLREEIRKKEISLHGVATVHEALAILFPQTSPSLTATPVKQKRTFRIVVLSVATLCLSILLFCWIFRSITDKKELAVPEVLPISLEKQEETPPVEAVQEIAVEQNTLIPAEELPDETPVQPDSAPSYNRGFE